MTKHIEDDDFENEDEIFNEDESYEIEKDDDEDLDDDSKSGISLIDDDDEDIDIIIEINEDELDISNDEDVKNSEEEKSEESDIVLSKHKIEGKHSLKYDSIFKGKKEEALDDDSLDPYLSFKRDTIEVDKSSTYHSESIDNESYVRAKLVKEKVYDVLKEHTNINFLNNRRKPSKIDFNNYFKVLKENLVDESFTNVELFIELAVYFSDNYFNMFKLLDNNWRNLIINELQDHIGKNANSKEITNRNIYEGTELEFLWTDENGVSKIITGVVVETYYDTSTFKVDSYENFYEVEISDITKILNNTKFKYNLNKLNNIDFL
jgi:hypothetical protein